MKTNLCIFHGIYILIFRLTTIYNIFTETKLLSFWRNFHHWLHWKLSFDNFQCSQWWKFNQNDNISISVLCYGFNILMLMIFVINSINRNLPSLALLYPKKIMPCCGLSYFLNLKGYFLIVKGQMDKGPNDGLSCCKQLMHAICGSSLLYESYVWVFEL